MPRARNIKHSFFVSEQVADNDPLGRLLFIGLWTIADFKGDLRWKPRSIKAQLLPFDNCDVEKLAINLDKSGLIRFYSDGEQVFINICSFRKHQNPHKNEREKGSDIPAYSENLRQVIDLDGLAINPDKTRLNHDQNGTPPADSLFLIPDSGYLKPDITPTSKSLISPCPVEQIINLYQDHCTRLPRLRVIPDKTKNAISARWRQDSKFQSLDFWKGFFDYCNENKFLSGQSNPRPGSDKPFRADLNWLVKPEPFANIINEKYA